MHQLFVDPPRRIKRHVRLAIRELIDAYAALRRSAQCQGPDSGFHRRHRVPGFHGQPVSGAELCHARREALSPVFADLNQYQATTHFNGQSTVRLNGDRATAESYCIAHHLTVNGDQRTLMLASIRYLDQLVKQDGLWLFGERSLMVDWADTGISAPWTELAEGSLRRNITAIRAAGTCGSAAVGDAAPAQPLAELGVGLHVGVRSDRGRTDLYD